MTRIALISDIHSNPFALDAVIKDLESRHLDEVLVVGDLVGRGPMGNAVVEKILKKGWPSVRGNHEDYLISFRDENVDEAWLTSEEWAASRWMASELSEASMAAIRALPFSMRSKRCSDVVLFHGSPRSNSEGLGLWSEESLLKECLFSVDCEVMVVAHTHRAMAWEFEGRLLINVGSVGLPFNGNRAAQYAIIEKEKGRWVYEFVAVDYELSLIEDAYEKSGFLSFGGITASLLLEELRHARPFLVPFRRWLDLIGEEESWEEMRSFLEWYCCTLSSIENVEIFHSKAALRKA